MVPTKEVMLCVYGAIWFYSKQLKSDTFVKTDICFYSFAFTLVNQQEGLVCTT